MIGFNLFNMIVLIIFPNSEGLEIIHIQLKEHSGLDFGIRYDLLINILFKVSYHLLLPPLNIFNN